MNYVKSRIEWLLWLLSRWEERMRVTEGEAKNILTNLEAERVRDLLLTLIKEYVNGGQTK